MNATIFRLAGLFLVCVGGYFTYSGWMTLFAEGYYRPKSSFIFPMVAVMGLGMIIGANTMVESRRRAGGAQLSWSETPLGVKIVGALGLVAGGLNLALISGII